MKKKILTTIGVVLGLSFLIAINTPASTKANSNLLLASVDWVQSQLNPLNSKVTTLEKKVAEQDAMIKQLQKAVSEGGTVIPPIPSTPDTPTPGTLPSVVYTNTGSVKVHSGATRNYKVLATFTANKSLNVIDQHGTGANLWYRVEVSSTVKGWVHSGDVTTTKPSNVTPSAVIAKEAVNIRKGATTSYASIELVVKGTSLKYISSFKNAKGETWYNVQSPKGNKGWVLSTLTEVR
ncbi:SH3 domain-containing protein [Psychrobacillus sp. MER TA 171]|uniref:SH3 domain-containing protein n=1 Tax=Psychrobacillus sp. MER TA 171 TaxID=2939577 RepID=UPI002041FB30|nr:SH3 domain-containing protein [Psychrobacillus sp. MER TA 171]MCM3356738.1 SH3 domain-containing protein [Psychrobacillus sp. MER TA 171]